MMRRPGSSPAPARWPGWWSGSWRSTEKPPGRRLGECGRALRDAMNDLGLSPELIELAPSRELEEPCIVRGSIGIDEAAMRRCAAVYALFAGYAMR